MEMKPEVKLELVHEMVYAVAIIAEVYLLHGCDACITSARDSHHGEGSKHPTGEAVDVRLPSRCLNPLDWDQKTSLFDRTVRGRLADRLGDQYDVILEDEVFHDSVWNMHIHVEWDPD